MIIRKAEQTDKEDIQLLMNKLNNHREQGFCEKNKDFHTRAYPYLPVTDQELDEDIFLIAIINSMIAGFIRGSIHERKNNTLHILGSIEELFVLEEFRRQGIAKILLVTLESEFKKRNCDHVTVHTDFENDFSRSFY
jgi:ribosomal protein S18 acetylase RimI-like enzyme